MELYGFSGKLGTGKNYVAEKLFLSMLPRKNTLVTALADQIKVDCVVKDNVDYEKAFHHKDDETRRLLQNRGTEDGRDKYGEDHWVNYSTTWHKVYVERGIERIIVTDVRFPNEIAWIKRMGGTSFRVEAPNRNKDQLERESEGNKEKYNAIANHLSETALDDPTNNYHNFDYVIRNDYDDQPGVANRVRDIVRELIYQKPTKLTIFCDLDDTICECGKFYKAIVDDVVKSVNVRTKICERQLESILNKHIYNFEKRYYTRDDFAKSLVKLAMEAHLEQDMVLELTDDYKNEIYRKGLDVYNRNYEALYPDSLDRVRQMCEYGQVVIFTLGDWTEQMKKIAYLGLMDLPVEIFTHKDENMFRYLQAKYLSEEYVMIGDSYQRDIVPARTAGIRHLVNVTKSGSGIPEPSSNEVGKYAGIKKIDRLNDELMNYLANISARGNV